MARKHPSQSPPQRSADEHKALGLDTIKHAVERARTEKPSTPQRGVELQGGFGMQGVVETLPVQRYPNNYIVEALEECTSADDVQTLIDHALQHTYSREGQTMQLLQGRLFELTKGKRGLALGPELQARQTKEFAARKAAHGGAAS